MAIWWYAIVSISCGIGAMVWGIICGGGIESIARMTGDVDWDWDWVYEGCCAENDEELAC